MTVIKVIEERYETGYTDKQIAHFFDTELTERKIEEAIYNARYNKKDRTRIEYLKTMFNYLGKVPQTYTFTINEDREYLESLKHGEKT